MSGALDSLASIAKHYAFEVFLLLLVGVATVAAAFVNRFRIHGRKLKVTSFGVHRAFTAVVGIGFCIAGIASLFEPDYAEAAMFVAVGLVTIALLPIRSRISEYMLKRSPKTKFKSLKEFRRYGLRADYPDTWKVHVEIRDRSTRQIIFEERKSDTYVSFFDAEDETEEEIVENMRQAMDMPSSVLDARFGSGGPLKIDARYGSPPRKFEIAMHAPWGRHEYVVYVWRASPNLFGVVMCYGPNIGKASVGINLILDSLSDSLERRCEV